MVELETVIRHIIANDLPLLSPAQPSSAYPLCDLRAFELAVLIEDAVRQLALRGVVPTVVEWHRAGGVGRSSGMDRLTDVPEFRRTRHRRKCSARVPRR